ncbi:MAG: winged helix DNA-binding domain-containing protein [Chloroflexi bacterium]|nr:winged helix DNA-binding domain-containing protein [Chloroflexota bacterium]
MRALTTDDLRQLRLRHQWLAQRDERSAAQVVRQLCALQSQEWASAQLAIHARTKSITQTGIQHAREVERSIVLSWSLRGTLHLVAAADLRWLLALCGEGVIRSTRRRFQQLGLTEAIREEALEAMSAILEREGAMNRADLAMALGDYCIPTAGQAIHHLLRFAALRGLLCHGPEVAGKLTFVLLDQWLSDTAPAPADPLGELARRYLLACAPATRQDFAQWSGLRAAQVKTAWAAVSAHSRPVATPAGEALMLADQLDSESKETMLRLLPRYDNYLLAQKDRRFIIAPDHVRQVYPGGGLIRACVLINGEAQAAWQLEKRRAGIRIIIMPFEGLDSAHLPLIEAETESIGKFLNTNAELRVQDG